ncbi:MAG: family 43 glycosylhydrolase, partial [Saccharothrix sp.]|nr:family 43 glycosylhydrolase [Saccharothrix sp.]
MRPGRNPVISGATPYPSVCRVGGDYYLVSASSEYFPGVPIFHSRDLAQWRQVGNVLTRPEQLGLPADTPASRGIHGTTLRHHDGRFHLIATNTSTGGNFVVTAERAAGRWSDPVWIDLPGVAPDLAWDDDGDCWCATSDGHVARVDPDTGAVLERPWRIWRPGPTPRLHRADGRWYLLHEDGDELVVARARTPRGP